MELSPLELYSYAAFDALVDHFPGFSDNIALVVEHPGILGVIANYVSVGSSTL